MAEVNVGDYLFRRIAELGVRSVFGVPGGLSVHCPLLSIEEKISSNDKSLVHLECF